MKLNKKGFTIIEGLLVIIAVTLIIGVGYYVMNANKTDNTSSNAAKKTPTNTVPQTTVPEKTDKELITAAVMSDMPGVTEANITIQEIVGDNAKGSVFMPNEGGAVFITHKEAGAWSIVFTGQQSPDPELAAKYNLPSDWYAH